MRELIWTKKKHYVFEIAMKNGKRKVLVSFHAALLCSVLCMFEDMVHNLIPASIKKNFLLYVGWKVPSLTVPLNMKHEDLFFVHRFSSCMDSLFTTNCDLLTFENIQVDYLDRYHLEYSANLVVLPSFTNVYIFTTIS